MTERKSQISTRMQQAERRLPLAEKIGIVSDIQAQPYKPLLVEGETLRIFNPNHIPELLGAIPGERGKFLRITYECSKEMEFSDEEQRQLTCRIIRSFFATLDNPQKVRFLPLMQPDGSQAATSMLAYPVALSDRQDPQIVSK